MAAIVHAGRRWNAPGAVAARRATLLIAACVVLAALASWGATHDVLLRALETTQAIIERHAFLGAVTFVALAAVSAMLAFFSVAVVVPAAVFAWGAPASMAMLWLGWILGGVLTYVIGRYLGRPALRWPAAERLLHRLEDELSPATPLWLITLVQLALPSEIPGYVLGLVRYPVARYLLALSVAELPFTVATVYVGTSFLQGRGGPIVAIGALLAVGSLCAAHAMRRHMTEAR